MYCRWYRRQECWLGVGDSKWLTGVLDMIIIIYGDDERCMRVINIGKDVQLYRPQPVVVWDRC